MLKDSEMVIPMKRQHLWALAVLQCTHLQAENGL
jgi:hypothetical protein